jgi:hypothetical protein
MGNKPTHVLVVKKKDSDAPGRRLGVAWESDKGISIRLYPCVTISDRDDVWISLYPYKKDWPSTTPPEDSDPDDEIPF